VGVGEIDQPMIRDRDTMRVSGQIMQNMVGAAEGPLGVNHPLLSEKGAEKSVERLLRFERKARAIEGKLLPAKGAFEASYELASKDPAQDSDRQKESRGRPDPPLAVRRQTAAGHDTVNVWVPLQSLSPGVQDAQEADLGSEMLGVGCYFEQRLRAGLE
jgi:hypothetical protein